ncbi:MAG: hypothetical protein HY608_10635 [Planctomycetes bacterium]|nr:hypothetical protein [Planctomycetota bacterium]
MGGGKSGLFLVVVDAAVIAGLVVCATLGADWPFLQAGFIGVKVVPVPSAPGTEPVESGARSGLGDSSPTPSAPRVPTPEEIAAREAADAERSLADADWQRVEPLWETWRSFMAEVEPQAGRLTDATRERLQTQFRELRDAMERFVAAHPQDTRARVNCHNMQERMGADRYHAIQGK